MDDSKQTIEITAADVESAIAQGLSDLGVGRDAVMVEVLEEPARRLLGLGSRQARVRLTKIALPPKAAEPAPAAAPDRPNRQRRPDRLPEPDSSDDLPLLEMPETPDDDETPNVPVGATELADEARAGAEILGALLQKMQHNVQVTPKQHQTEGNEPAHWVLEITGTDVAALIGRRGETLAALQYLTRLLVSRKIGRRAYLVVDVEGYKERRETMLRRLARRMAEQAVQRGRVVSMEPMPPHERRIIHLTLKNNPDVTTESVGEGSLRKVTVVPRGLNRQSS
jgi:spoIIIJ-associated protein